MRSSAWMAAFFVLVGCESNTPDISFQPPSPVAPANQPDESIDRLRAERVEGLPAARGGGPAATVYWPSQAREALAQARCQTLSSCGLPSGASGGCLERESSKLANWPVDTCDRIVLDSCLSAVRATGCAELDWRLSSACAPTQVCTGPELTGW